MQSLIPPHRSTQIWDVSFFEEAINAIGNHGYGWHCKAAACMPLDLTQPLEWGNQHLRCFSDWTVGLHFCLNEDPMITKIAQEMSEDGLVVAMSLADKDAFPTVQHHLGLVGLKGIPKKECLSTLESILDSSRFDFDVHILGERGLPHAFLKNLLGNDNTVIIEKVAIHPYNEDWFSSGKFRLSGLSLFSQGSCPPGPYDISIEKEKLSVGRFRDARYQLLNGAVRKKCPQEPHSQILSGANRILSRHSRSISIPAYQTPSLWAAVN